MGITMIIISRLLCGGCAQHVISIGTPKIFQFHQIGEGVQRYELTKAKYLLDNEREALNSTLERFKDTDPRNCTLLWLALHTGARASELLNITREDFCPVENTVWIKGLKDSNNREIPLPKWLAARVSSLVPGKNGRIFPITYIRFYQIWLLYRPVKKKLHSLRHTFAINVYRKSKNIKALQIALGHRNWNNTMIYANYQYGTSEMREILLGGT
jgi:integrase